MTGLTETEHLVNGLESGGVDYLTKPINIDELRARIRVHLSNAVLCRVPCCAGCSRAAPAGCSWQWIAAMVNTAGNAVDQFSLRTEDGLEQVTAGFLPGLPIAKNRPFPAKLPSPSNRAKQPHCSFHFWEPWGQTNIWSASAHSTIVPKMLCYAATSDHPA